MLVFDIGNSTIRAALHDGCGFRWIRSLSRPAGECASPLSAWLSARKKDAGDHLAPGAAIASVVPADCAQIESWFLAQGVKTWRIDPLAAGFMRHHLLTPGTTGIDRLCAAWAAWEGRKAPVIVVDIGTALTVDAVDAEGVFLGGAILPGSRLWLSALSRGTALLPEIDSPRSSTPSIGRDTESAIQSGHLYGIAGAVERLVRTMAEELKISPFALLTGGGASWLSTQLPFPVEIRPDLVLEGAVLFAGLWWGDHRG